MQTLSIPVPDELFGRIRTLVSQQQFRNLLVDLLERELQLRDTALYHCACQVEADEALKQDLLDWNMTLEDGLENESW